MLGSSVFKDFAENQEKVIVTVLPLIQNLCNSEMFWRWPSLTIQSDLVCEQWQEQKRKTTETPGAISLQYFNSYPSYLPTWINFVSHKENQSLKYCRISRTSKSFSFVWSLWWWLQFSSLVGLFSKSPTATSVHVVLYSSMQCIYQKGFFSSLVILKITQAAGYIPYVQSYFWWAFMSLNLL